MIRSKWFKLIEKERTDLGEGESHLEHLSSDNPDRMMYFDD